MSWLSSAIKKIKKVQPGKALAKVATAAVKAVPIAGSIVGAAEAFKSNKAAASAAVSALPETVSNVNAAAQDTSKMKTYIGVGVAAIVIVLILWMLTKKGR